LERYEAIQEKLESLKKKVHDLKQEYPDRSTTPPEEIKQELIKELIDMLDVLK